MHTGDNASQYYNTPLQVIPDTRSHFVTRIPGPGHSNIPTPSSKRPSSAGKKSSPQSQTSSPKQAKSASSTKQQQPTGSPQVAKRLIAAEKTPPSSELPPAEEEFQPMGVSRVSPPVGEVTDLNQRLTILQGKRVEDKARIKELEKFKAHYLQVWDCSGLREGVFYLECTIDDGVQAKVDRVPK